MGPTLPSPLQQQVDKFSNPTNRCIHCGGAHVPGSCPVRYQPKATSSTSKYGSSKQSTEDNNVASVQVRSQVTPQVSPLAQVNTLAQSAYSLFKLTVVLVSLLQTNKRNCSRTEQISRHSPTIPASDADFVQSAQEEESSLDQTTKGIDREPSRFRAFRPGLERVQRDLHDSQQPGITRQDLESTKEPREYNKFRTIRINYPRIHQNCRYPLEENTIPKSARSKSSRGNANSVQFALGIVF